MKAFTALFGLVFFASSSFAAIAISDFTQSADKNFTFKLMTPEGAQEVRGDFQNADVAVLNAAGKIIQVKMLEKFVIIATVNGSVNGPVNAPAKNEPKTKTGELYILEEMNSLYIPLTLAPMIGSAASLHDDGFRMIEISRIASGGDLAVGVQKLVEAFRQNPKLTIQAQLARQATRPKNASIGVGTRNRIQAVRSFEELEGLPPVTTYVAKKKALPKKRIVKRKPNPPVNNVQPGMRWLPQATAPTYYYY